MQQVRSKYTQLMKRINTRWNCVPQIEKQAQSICQDYIFRELILSHCADAHQGQIASLFPKVLNLSTYKFFLPNTHFLIPDSTPNYFFRK